MLRKVSAITAAVAAAAVPVLAGAPTAGAATTAYPTSYFSVQAGDSWYAGQITWYNRSVGLDGYLNAYGCKRAYGISWAGTTPLDERSTSTHCENYTEQNLSLAANVPGGADHVRINLTDANGKVLAYKYYFRP